MVCGSCHANVSRSSHELQGYTFGLRPGLIQDSGGFCQIVSSQRENNSTSASQGRVLTPRPFFFFELAKSDPSLTGQVPSISPGSCEPFLLGKQVPKRSGGLFQTGTLHCFMLQRRQIEDSRKVSFLLEIKQLVLRSNSRHSKTFFWLITCKLRNTPLVYRA